MKLGSIDLGSKFVEPQPRNNSELISLFAKSKTNSLARKPMTLDHLGIGMIMSKYGFPASKRALSFFKCSLVNSYLYESEGIELVRDEWRPSN